MNHPFPSASRRARANPLQEAHLPSEAPTPASLLLSAGSWRGRLVRALRPASFILLASLLCAQTGSLESLLATMRKQVQTADFRVTGQLVWVQPDGARLNYPITIKAHWFPGVLRERVDLGQPAAAHREMREHILLEMRPDGEDTVRIAEPGDTAPRLLPFAQWSAHPLVPGFDFEDLLDQQFFWPGQLSEGSTKFGARTCILVRSTPGPGDHTRYAQVRTWIDPSIDFAVYMEKTLREGGAVKEFTYFGLRHDEGVWSARQIGIKLRGQSGSVLLIVDRGSAHARLTAADFSPAGLTRF